MGGGRRLSRGDNSDNDDGAEYGYEAGDDDRFRAGRQDGRPDSVTRACTGSGHRGTKMEQLLRELRNLEESNQMDTSEDDLRDLLDDLYDEGSIPDEVYDDIMDDIDGLDGFRND